MCREYIYGLQKSKILNLKLNQVESKMHNIKLIQLLSKVNSGI